MNKERAVTNSQKKSNTQSILKIMVGKKIAIGFLAVVTIFMIFGFFIYSNEASVEKATLHVSEEIIPELELLQELKMLSLKTLLSTMEVVLILEGSGFVEQESLEEKKAEISDAKNKFENTLLTLHDLVKNDPDKLSKFIHINGEWKKISRLSEEMIQAKEMGVEDEAIMELKKKLQVDDGHLVGDIDKSMDLELREVDENNKLVKSLFNNNLQIIFFGIISIIAISMIIGWVVSKKIEYDQKTIIEQKKKLEENMSELRKAELLKEEFASMVTHELNTPLTPIRGYCEMLLDRDSFGSLTDSQVGFIKKIDSSATMLERLIGDILDAQKLDMKRMTFNKEGFEVDEFLDEFKQDSEPLMKDKGIKFIVTDSVKTSIKTDQLRLRQVLDNLVRNAIDFVPPKNGKIEVSAKQENGKMIFHVKDNGIGIPKEKQINIFKKFYQVDTSFTRKHGGTGLGLVICRGIVDALGGEIWFESEPGKETTFYFSIPIFKEKITTEPSPDDEEA